MKNRVFIILIQIFFIFGFNCQKSKKFSLEFMSYVDSVVFSFVTELQMMDNIQLNNNEYNLKTFNLVTKNFIESLKSIEIKNITPQQIPLQTQVNKCTNILDNIYKQTLSIEGKNQSIIPIIREAKFVECTKEINILIRSFVKNK